MLATPLVLEKPQFCHYLPTKMAQMETFLAQGVSGEDLDFLLSEGWRKFGEYYFKPSCPDCQACIPIRINCKNFEHSKSQKRILRKNQETEVRFVPLKFREEIFQIHQAHSETKFNRSVTREEIKQGFYKPSCPSMQSEYYIENTLAAVGYLDQSSKALSSVYFVYHPDFSAFSLGHFAVLAEVKKALTLGLDFYYLGYWIEGNKHMKYKANYQPHEKFNWEKGEWI